MRQVGADRHGAGPARVDRRPLAWRPSDPRGLALSERDLDPGRRSILVRRGKGGRRREVDMDESGFEQLRPWLSERARLPVGPLFCVIDGPTRGRPWSAAGVRVELRRLAAEAHPGGASHRISSATRTRSSSPARAFRSTSSASSVMPTSARRASTCRESTPRRSSPRFM